MSQASSQWIPAADLTDLPVDGRKLVRHYDKRIALFRSERGIYAVDNRCPHQGYALLQGDLKGETLTCAWHNWKFELDQDGRCSFGGEAVRAYPVEVRAGQVYVDVTDPAAEVIAPQLFASLLEAMGEVDIGRLARDTMRLRQIGTPLTEVVREGVNFGAPRMEYGWNHSLATLTDCLNLASLFEGELQTLPVIQGLAVVSENEVRRPERPRPDPIDPVAVYGSIDAALAAYPPLVDGEEKEEAEALMRGLIAAGVEPTRIRHALLTAITDHFLGYGHPMIYVHKSFEMLDRIGWAEADTVIGPLVPTTVLSTRYDRLPYMRRFLRAWDSAEVDLEAVLPSQNSGAFAGERMRRTVLDGSPEESVAVLVDVLKKGCAVADVIDVLSAAASERLRRFDIDIDTDDTNEWGWLDVTHNLTYLDAFRWAWAVSPSPQLLRGLFHAVWFVNFTRRFDERAPRARPVARAHSSVEVIVDVIQRRDPEGAEALIAGFEGPEEALHGALARGASEDNSVAPIMVAHSVKTARASIVESVKLRSREPLVAAGRFLASPKRERFVYNATLEAIDFTAGRARGEDR